MSDALELTRAILGGDGPKDITALQVLEAALEREVDVLHYCAGTLGMDAALVMQRAAAWAGYGFFERVPQGLRGTTLGRTTGRTPRPHARQGARVGKEPSPEGS